MSFTSGMSREKLQSMQAGELRIMCRAVGVPLAGRESRDELAAKYFDFQHRRRQAQLEYTSPVLGSRAVISSANTAIGGAGNLMASASNSSATNSSSSSGTVSSTTSSTGLVVGTTTAASNYTNRARGVEHEDDHRSRTPKRSFVPQQRTAGLGTSITNLASDNGTGVLVAAPGASGSEDLNSVTCSLTQSVSYPRLPGLDFVDVARTSTDLYGNAGLEPPAGGEDPIGQQMNGTTVASNSAAMGDGGGSSHSFGQPGGTSDRPPPYDLHDGRSVSASTTTDLVLNNVQYGTAAEEHPAAPVGMRSSVGGSFIKKRTDPPASSIRYAPGGGHQQAASSRRLSGAAGGQQQLLQPQGSARRDSSRGRSRNSSASASRLPPWNSSSHLGSSTSVNLQGGAANNGIPRRRSSAGPMQGISQVAGGTLLSAPASMYQGRRGSSAGMNNGAPPIVSARSSSLTAMEHHLSAGQQHGSFVRSASSPDVEMDGGGGIHHHTSNIGSLPGVGGGPLTRASALRRPSVVNRGHLLGGGTTSAALIPGGHQAQSLAAEGGHHAQSVNLPAGVSSNNQQQFLSTSTLSSQPSPMGGSRTASVAQHWSSTEEKEQLARENEALRARLVAVESEKNSMQRELDLRRAEIEAEYTRFVAENQQLLSEKQRMEAEARRLSAELVTLRDAQTRAATSENLAQQAAQADFQRERQKLLEEFQEERGRLQAEAKAFERDLHQKFETAVQFRVDQQVAVLREEKKKVSTCTPIQSKMDVDSTPQGERKSVTFREPLVDASQSQADAGAAPSQGGVTFASSAELETAERPLDIKKLTSDAKMSDRTPSRMPQARTPGPGAKQAGGVAELMEKKTISTSSETQQEKQDAQAQNQSAGLVQSDSDKRLQQIMNDPVLIALTGGNLQQQSGGSSSSTARMRGNSGPADGEDDTNKTGSANTSLQIDLGADLNIDPMLDLDVGDDSCVSKRGGNDEEWARRSLAKIMNNAAPAELRKAAAASAAKRKINAAAGGTGSSLPSPTAAGTGGQNSKSPAAGNITTGGGGATITGITAGVDNQQPPPSAAASSSSSCPSPDIDPCLLQEMGLQPPGGDGDSAMVDVPGSKDNVDRSSGADGATNADEMKDPDSMEDVAPSPQRRKIAETDPTAPSSGSSKTSGKKGSGKSKGKGAGPAPPPSGKKGTGGKGAPIPIGTKGSAKGAPGKKGAKNKIEPFNGVKLRPVFWNQVPFADDDTSSNNCLWGHLPSVRFDEKVLETQFPVVSAKVNIRTNPATGGPFGGGGRAGGMSASDRILTILDSNRSQHLNIIFKQLPQPQLVIDALNGIGNPLKPEMARILYKEAFISDAERKRMQELHLNKAPGQQWGIPERYFIAVTKAPRSYQVLRAWSCLGTFGPVADECRSQLADFQKALGILVGNRLLEHIMAMMLAVGNRMNAGTLRGNSRAFAVDSLAKFGELKNVEGTRTLLSFILEFMQCEIPIVDIRQWRQIIAKAKRVPLLEVEKRVAEISQEAQLCSKDCYEEAEKNPPSEVIQQHPLLRYAPEINQCAATGMELMSDVKRVQEDFLRALKYFCYNCSPNNGGNTADSSSLSSGGRSVSSSGGNQAEEFLTPFEELFSQIIAIQQRGY
ncbi:unnamed protein product [Amoebophrya sp. A25]|nr:unnamed protein product [Amoebophrya sp. A25]|eukprot:GSA25T00011168001.1